MADLKVINGDGVMLHRLGALGVYHCVPTKKTSPHPIVFAAGLGFGGWVFRDLMLALAALGHETFAVSFRGHPGSEPVEGLGYVGIADYEEDYRFVLETIGRPLITAGHSMGGLVTALAATDNVRVVGHISMASAPPRGMISGLRAWTKIPVHLPEILGSRAVAFERNDVRELFFNGLSDRDFESLFGQMCPESGTVIREIVFMRHKLRRLHCPAMVVAAKNDLITPYQTGVARRLGATPDSFRTMPTGHVQMLCPPFVGDLAQMIHRWIEFKVNPGYPEFRQAA